jgi:hypothetical protein
MLFNSPLQKNALLKKSSANTTIITVNPTSS